jgi:hypothetical protein
MARRNRVYHRDANGRVVAENDDAISASRYGMMMRRHAREPLSPAA